MQRQVGGNVHVFLGAVLALLLFAGPLAAESWVGPIQTPQYFAVRVADMDGTVSWYLKALGMKKLDDTRADDDRWRIVNLANDALSVELIRDNRDHERERPRGLTKVGFRVADVDAVADRVEKATGERPRIVEFAEHGIHILQLRDPEGNVIQLSSPMPATPGAP